MFRLLAILQLTRAALAFTAIADAWAVLLLRMPDDPAPDFWITVLKMVVMAGVSFGLYSFGMALNDLLDVRRDRVFAPRRPIPSGRIKPQWAVVLALLLLMGALLAAAMLTVLHVWELSLRGTGGGAGNWLHVRDIVPYSFIFALAAAGLIVFYDATSKHLGGMGLVTLGLIRGLHCLIGNPRTPMLFLSMILMTHVIVVSTIAYRLENKRPRLNRGDVLTVVMGLVIGNGVMLAYMMTRRQWGEIYWPALIGPGIAGAVYVAWACGVMLSKKLMPRQKGERLMLMGLFWLFVYDASMLLANGQWLAGVAITLCLLCAVGSFFGIRWMSRGSILPRVGYRTERTESPAG